MKKMAYWVRYTCFALLFFLLGQQSFATPALNQVINFIQSHKGFSLNFLETNYDAYNQQTLKAAGSLDYYQGLLRFEYSEPEKQTIVVGEKKIWVYDPVLNNVTIENVDKIKALDSLLFFRKTEALNQVFKEEKVKVPLLTPKPNEGLLNLVPKKKEGLVKQVQIAYDKKIYSIEQIVIVDNQENIRMFQFSNFTSKSNFSAKDFVFILPKNVETIENE